MTRWVITAALVLTGAASFLRAAETSPKQPAKVRGVYTNITNFDSRAARNLAVNAQPGFLMEKHKRLLADGDNAESIKLARDCGFDTLFMTIYPLWGKEWWSIPAARNLVKDALVQAHANGFRVHLGLSLFNANICEKPERFAGASGTIQCDGTRPSWVCFFDDGLWDFYRQNVVEMAKVGREVPDTLDGILVDPEAYGPECYLCFCDECVGKFDACAHADMPRGLVKPDAWLHGHEGMWKKYTVDWHDQEVRRHASALRDAIHGVDSKLQLSSLLWDYPVAVGIGDARQQYFRMLAIGLATKEQPAWTLPEHTYYSDAADLDRIIGQIASDIDAAGAKGLVKVLPGIRLLRRDAASLLPRGEVIDKSSAAGYWMYELDDLDGKRPIDFEGTLVDPAGSYVKKLAEMNRAMGK